MDGQISDMMTDIGKKARAAAAELAFAKSERKCDRRIFNLKRNMLKVGSNVYFLRRLQDSSERSAEGPR